MKIALWAVVVLLALLWTGSAAVTAGLTSWAAGQVASGAAAELGTAAAQWPVPAWLAPWVDPALLRAAQEAVLWGLQVFRELLPWLGGALGWLVPLVWIGWGLGLALLLVVAVVLHLLAGRMFGAPTPAR